MTEQVALTDGLATRSAVAAPTIVIEVRTDWGISGLRELWRYRELLFFLAWRDVKVRYQQTVLGAAWAVLQPLATMVVFSLIFGRVAQVASGDVPYPVFVLCGLLPWFYVSNSIASATQSIVANHSLVTKVYFPRLIIPTTSVAAGLVDFAIGLALLAPMMAYQRIVPGPELLWLPAIIAALIMLSLGVGALLAALTVAYRDVKHIVPFSVQLWMFATPAIYLNAHDAFGPGWRALLPLNPAHGLIANFRAAVLGTGMDWGALGVSLAVTIVLFVGGMVYFRRVERGFADVI